MRHCPAITIGYRYCARPEGHSGAHEYGTHRVIRTDDDAPVPTLGTIIGATDTEYVTVLWDGSGVLRRVASDELAWWPGSYPGRWTMPKGGE